MKQPPSHPSIVVLATCGLAALMLFTGCEKRSEIDESESPVFEVNLDLVGSVYENQALGIRLRPPAGWEQLEGSHRQAVLDALIDSETGDDYSLAVQDIFFDTVSLSFLSVSVVTSPDGTVERETYVETFADMIGLDPEADPERSIVSRMDFDVNDVPVIQFRHLMSNRVTFTLILDGQTDLVRLDYSIPSERYQQESVKLESSIGTLVSTGQ